MKANLHLKEQNMATIAAITLLTELGLFIWGKWTGHL